MVVTDTRLLSDQHKQLIRTGQVLEEIYLARDNERRRLSAEIHDGVVQWMVGALYRISACSKHVPRSESDNLEEELAGIAATLKESVSELRRIIADLHPPPLEKLGLAAALRQATFPLEEAGITCHFKVDGVPPKLTPVEERATFGMIQEALTNIRKHSGATIMYLHLQFRDDAVSVKLSDNGRGFNLEEAIDSRIRPSHIGLLSMKDRAEMIGAHLDIDSHLGKGTSISFAFSPASLRTTPATAGR